MDNAIGLPNTYKLYSSLCASSLGRRRWRSAPESLLRAIQRSNNRDQTGTKTFVFSSGRQMNPYMVCKHFDSNCKLQKPLYELWMTLDWTQKDIEPKSQKKRKNQICRITISNQADNIRWSSSIRSWYQVEGTLIRHKQKLFSIKDSRFFIFPRNRAKAELIAWCSQTRSQGSFLLDSAQ